MYLYLKEIHYFIKLKVPNFDDYYIILLSQSHQFSVVHYLKIECLIDHIINLNRLINHFHIHRNFIIVVFIFIEVLVFVKNINNL